MRVPLVVERDPERPSHYKVRAVLLEPGDPAPTARDAVQALQCAIDDLLNRKGTFSVCDPLKRRRGDGA